VVRKLRLGESIDTESIAGDYADGVLTVTLPVAEKAKPRKVVVAGAAAAPEVAAEQFPQRRRPETSVSGLRR
jgi:HSP20 family protein